MSYDEMKTEMKNTIRNLEATFAQQQMWARRWCVKACRLTRAASLLHPTFICLFSRDTGGETENLFPF